MFKKIIKIASVTGIILISSIIFAGLARNIIYKTLAIENISRYTEDRVAFQHIQTIHEPYSFDKKDNSIASLLIIKDKKMYLLKDGYDDKRVVNEQKTIYQMQNRLFPDLWVNKIDNKPDYIIKTDRRIPILRKIEVNSKLGENKNLDEKYTKFYTEIRNKFIKKHINIFKKLMLDRKDSGIFVVRKPLPNRLSYNGPTKYFMSVQAKTKNGRLYYAEDANGDGITETFSVNLKDGFDWGYKSGPNIIFIYKCKFKDKKGNPTNTKIKELIGNICHIAYYGFPKEYEMMKKNLEDEKDEIDEMIDNLDEMYKPYKIK